MRSSVVAAGVLKMAELRLRELPDEYLSVITPEQAEELEELSDSVDTAYERGEYDKAEDLDVELEERLLELEHALEEDQTEREPLFEDVVYDNYDRRDLDPELAKIWQLKVHGVGGLSDHDAVAAVRDVLLTASYMTYGIDKPKVWEKIEKASDKELLELAEESYADAKKYRTR